jgi:hypothetical protein
MTRIIRSAKEHWARRRQFRRTRDWLLTLYNRALLRGSLEIGHAAGFHTTTMKQPGMSWTTYCRIGFGRRLSLLGERLGIDWLTYNPIHFRHFHEHALAWRPRRRSSCSPPPPRPGWHRTHQRTTQNPTGSTGSKRPA